MKIDLTEKELKLLESHLDKYIEKNHLNLDPNFIVLYNNILDQHYYSKVKELTKWTTNLLTSKRMS